MMCTEGHTILSITESLSPPGCFNVKIGEFSSGEKYGHVIRQGATSLHVVWMLRFSPWNMWN